MSETEELIERLRFFGKDILPDCNISPDLIEDVLLAADRLAALEGENWQLKQALGYPIPSEFDTPQNPFRCGSCDARSALSPERKMRDLYNNEIDYLSARETTLMAMINRLSDDDVMTKISLEGELEQVRKELASHLSPERKEG